MYLHNKIFFCSPEDLLYEFYTRTTAEIADMKRDRRLLEARNPQTFKDIIVRNLIMRKNTYMHKSTWLS